MAKNSFDELVINMPQAERIELYNRLIASLNASEQTLVENTVPEEYDNTGDIEKKLKTESRFFKFLLYIRSLFSGTDSVSLYNTILIERTAKYVEKKYPTILNAKKSILKASFYDRLRSLKTAADFFQPGIDLYEEDPGRFYVFLSSLLLPEIYEKIELEIDPFKFVEDKDASQEVRTAQLRRLEEIFQEITSAARTNLYNAVSGIDWLRQFMSLPFEKFLSKFMTISAGEYLCQIDSVSNEISQFARVLCNGRVISTEILQAMFLFSFQSQLGNPEIDITALTSEYVGKSISYIGVIKRFLENVPLRLLGEISHKSATWVPKQPDGVEDWFIKYKNEWKKLFDIQWEKWVNYKKQCEIDKKIKEMFSTEELPQMPFQPWKNVWEDLAFMRQKSISFLYGFFSTKYPDVSKLLKILMIEGDFKQRENRIEFTDSYDQMNHLGTNVETLVFRFAPQGDIGQVFKEVEEKNERTVKTHSRLENLISSAYSEAGIYFTQFTNNVTILANVIEGIISESKVGKYDTLNNIAAIQGRKNQAYRQQLAGVRTLFLTAIECLNTLISLENK